MGETPVQVRALARRFGARVALEGVELDVAAGEIVGLAGPNGSGKTTLIRLLAGFLRPSSGSVRVHGLDPRRDQPRVMRRARFAFAPPALYPSLTAREHLRHVTAFGLPRASRWKDGRIEAALEEVGLRERADDRVGTYSLGMRQRLVLALALSPAPDLLVLDEPTDGLDPLAVLELRGVLRRVHEEHGTTIVLSSHLLVEVEELVDRLLVLDEGRPLFLGPPEELVRGGERLVLEVDDSALAREALGAGEVSSRVADARTLELTPGALSLGEAHELLRAKGLELQGYSVRRPSLEEALLERLRGRTRERGT